MGIFKVKYDLEGQSQYPDKVIGILTEVFYTSDLNWIILAWTGDQLSRGQTRDWHAHGDTNTSSDKTRRSKLASSKMYGIEQTAKRGFE